MTRSVKLPKTAEEMQAIAARFCIGHDTILAGYSLTAASRCWESKQGMTARLVYRQRDIDVAGIATITIIVKGIPLAHA